MKRKWIYLRLFDKSGRMAGYMRESDGRAEFWNGIGERWFREPIDYADRVPIAEMPIGLRSLKGCR